MMKPIIFSAFLFFCFSASAQTREELEKQRQQLKKDIEEAQKLANQNKVQTKASLTAYLRAQEKVNLQSRLVDNLGRDVRLLDDNIYTIQRDVNKYDRLLDTLKQEYAKSMVYAYKNRSNYEFLNFIFSADNFNDAIKRISYLKSYRSFREMQGENILRTQEMRRKKLQDLGVSKQKKNETLGVQKQEMGVLEQQKQEQNKIVTELKKEGKDLNARIAAKQKQMAKVNNAIKAAIAKAIADEKKRIADLAAAERAKKAADAKAAANSGSSPAVKATAPVKVKGPTKKDAPTSEELNAGNIALSNSFEKNKGNLPWPVDNGAVLNHYGQIRTESGAIMDITCTTISSSIGTPVKAVFDGTVILVTEVDDGKYTVTIKHGNYYTSYSNINSVSVKKDQEVSTGQTLGRVASNLDGIGAIDFYAAKGNTDLDPEKWLRHR